MLADLDGLLENELRESCKLWQPLSACRVLWTTILFEHLNILGLELHQVGSVRLGHPGGHGHQLAFGHVVVHMQPSHITCLFAAAASLQRRVPKISFAVSSSLSAALSRWT